jgi:hypothetical protein
VRNFSVSAVARHKVPSVDLVALNGVAADDACNEEERKKVHDACNGDQLKNALLSGRRHVI